MARFGGSRPQYSISTSVAVRKGKYVKGPSFGLWDADSGPMARGSVKEDYLDDLISFLDKAASNGQSVSFSLFKNDERDGGGRRRSRDRDEDRDEDRRRDRDEERDEEDKRDRKRGRGREEEADEKEEKEERREKRSSKGGKESSRKGGKKSGKDWDFDDED